MTDTKICPYCAEEIKAAAVKCRYCHSDLTEGERERGLEPVAVVEPAPVAAPAPAPVPAAEAGATAADAGVTEEGDEAPTAPAWLRRFESTRLVVVLSVVALLLAAGIGYLGYDLSRMSGAESARSSGAAAAEVDVQKILSYSYGSFDKGTTQAQALMTPSFRREYADTVKLVRKDALSTRSTVKAQVVARSVVRAEPHRVEALLFVNQTTTGAGLEQPRVDLNRVVVTMVPDGSGGWLVDRLKAL